MRPSKTVRTCWVASVAGLLAVSGAVSVGGVSRAAVAAPVAPIVPAGGPLPVGLRLSWYAGDATLQGTKLVPDANGWLWKDDQWWSVQSSGGSGGIGLTQITVQSASPDGVVADVRYLLRPDPELDVHVPSAADLLLGDSQALGDYWISPAVLATMQPGYDGTTRIWRGPRLVNGQTYDAVSSATMSGGTYTSYTYDAATGVLLIGGMMVAQPGVLVTDPQGNVLDSASGAVSLNHRIFAAARQVSIPWAAEPPPEWASVGRTLTYQGEVAAEFDPATGAGNLPGIPQAVSYVFDRAVGTALVGRAITRSSNGAGLPPTDSTANRVFGSAMFDGLWIPPAYLPGLTAGQVLDDDVVSGHRVVFAGIQGNVAVIQSGGAGDQLEMHYDTASGVAVFARYRWGMGAVGAQVTTMTLAGQ